jgi:hypothetical protein
MPADLGAGQLRQIVSVDDTGRKISSFVGDPAAWMGDFTGQRRRMTRINQGA